MVGMQVVSVVSSMSEMGNKPRPHQKTVFGLSPVRHSPPFNSHLGPSSSQSSLNYILPSEKGKEPLSEEKEEKTGNAPLISQRDVELQLSTQSSTKSCSSEGEEDEEIVMESASAYEAMRIARILENQARMESLGIEKTVYQGGEQGKKPRPQPKKKVHSVVTPLRRSQRIINLSQQHSQPLKDTLSTPPLSTKQEMVTLCKEKKIKEEEHRPANAPFISLRHADLQISTDNKFKEEEHRLANAPFISLGHADLQISTDNKFKEEEYRPAYAPFISPRHADLQIYTENNVKEEEHRLAYAPFISPRHADFQIYTENELKEEEYRPAYAPFISPRHADLHIYTENNFKEEEHRPAYAPFISPRHADLQIYTENNFKEEEHRPAYAPFISPRHADLHIYTENNFTEEEHRHAYAPFISLGHADLQISPESSVWSCNSKGKESSVQRCNSKGKESSVRRCNSKGRESSTRRRDSKGKDSSVVRCDSKGRGSVYDPVIGISCHFCRQKKLCGEANCKRCGNLDVNEPCLGKSDCSVCHSSTGIFCRACLKVRYGEELEEVRENKGWMCPHCIEEKGTNPYWICNSSICLRKRKIAPTGVAVYKARKMGYKSVAHLLMEELKWGKNHLRDFCM